MRIAEVRHKKPRSRLNFGGRRDTTLILSKGNIGVSCEKSNWIISFVSCRECGFWD